MNAEEATPQTYTRGLLRYPRLLLRLAITKRRVSEFANCINQADTLSSPREWTCLMRHETRSMPNSDDGSLRHLGLLVRGTGAPVRGIFGLVLESLYRDFLYLFVVQRAVRTGARFIEQAVQSPCAESLAPEITLGAGFSHNIRGVRRVSHKGGAS